MLEPKYFLHHEDCLDLLPRLGDESIDLTITSPPYFIGKEYDSSRDVSDFRSLHEKLLPEIVRVTRDGGSICWQVGYHVENGVIEPLDFIIHDIMSHIPNIRLRNRVIWHFGHGLHATRRFSNRHEVILWYTKGNHALFDLDAVRIPQKYPGKRSFKGGRAGEFSGNPLGKNPSDVWEIPNINANHVEKTSHPCQFPVALASRFIRALTPKIEGVVLDPFMGSGSTGVASILNARNFIGAELDQDYLKIARDRCDRAADGSLRVRQDVPVITPNPNAAVSQRPAHFVTSKTELELSDFS